VTRPAGSTIMTLMRSLCPLAFLAACHFSSPSGIDAGRTDGGGEYTMVEELVVPSDGLVVISTTLLQAGVVYRLRASGSYWFNFAGNQRGDAEYFGYNSGDPTDVVGGIDIGIAVNDAIIDGTRTPRWGAYTEPHTYEVEWIGDGKTIFVQLHDGNYDNNDGTMDLAIFAPR
jgi:hypothetical protein